MLHAIRFSAAVTCLLAASVAAQGIPKQEAKLVPVTGVAGGSFGDAVAINGDDVVVGDGHGNAKVFVRTGTVWAEQAALVPIGTSTAGYGRSVAISGNTAVVGDPGVLTGMGVGPGAAFVYVRTGDAWTQQAVLTPSDAGGSFGSHRSVAISGDIAAVGDGTAGRTYIYERTGTTWTEAAKFSGPVDFGSVVSASGDAVLVGSDLANEARVYARTQGVWSLQATLHPAQGSYAEFAKDVALSGNTAIASVWDYVLSDRVIYVFTRSGTTWVHQSVITSPQASGDFAGALALSDIDDIIVAGVHNATVAGHTSAGLANVFLRAGGSWGHQGTMVASDAADGDDFGIAVAVAGDTAIAGAQLGDSAVADSGAAYIFHPVQPWLKLGGGLGGGAGVPMLAGAGTLDPGSSGSLTLSNAAPFTLTMLFVSLANTPTPFKGGVLSTVPIAFQLPVGTFFTGSWTLPWSPWPAGVPSGSELFFQVGVSDAAAVKGVAISNLLKATQP